MEKDVERKLVKGIKDLGGVAYKFVSPGNSGVPDRIVILPGRAAEFVELKTISGKLTALQSRQIVRLKGLGCAVQVLYGEPDVVRYLLKKRGDAL